MTLQSSQINPGRTTAFYMSSKETFMLFKPVLLWDFRLRAARHYPRLSLRLALFFLLPKSIWLRKKGEGRDPTCTPLSKPWIVVWGGVHLDTEDIIF